MKKRGATRVWRENNRKWRNNVFNMSRRNNENDEGMAWQRLALLLAPVTRQ